MKYQWLWLIVLILGGCSQANVRGNETIREYNITVNNSDGSSLTMTMPLSVDAIVTESLDQTTNNDPATDTDLPVSLAAQGATASTSGSESTQEITKPVSDYRPVITPAPVVVPPVVTPEPTPVPLPVPPDEVVPPIDPDDPTVPPEPTPESSTLIEKGDFRGVTDGRPYWNFSKAMKDYPKAFWLVMGKCYAGTVENDGERWQTPNGRYVVKQSYKGWWNTAVIGDSSCESETASFYEGEPK